MVLADNMNFVPAHDPLIQYVGRADFSDPEAVCFDWPGVSVRAVFEGKNCTVRMMDGNNAYNFYIDGAFAGKITCVPGQTEYPAAENLADGRHTIVLMKRTEPRYGVCRFLGFLLDPGKKLLSPSAVPGRRIELIGDSLSCGYGIEAPNAFCGDQKPFENPDLTCVGLLAKKLDADLTIIAFSGKGLVRNYGETGPVSDDPLPFYYDRTLANDPDKKWNFTKSVPGLVIIHLGWNDFWSDSPDRKIFTGGLRKLIDRVRANYPGVPVLCLSMTKPRLREMIQSVVSDLEKEGDGKIGYCDIGIVGSTEFGCDYHPNAKANARFLERLLPAAVKLTGWDK